MVTAIAYVNSNTLIRDSVQEQLRLLCQAVTLAVDNTCTRTRQFVSFAASMPMMANVVSGQNREQALKLLSNLTVQDQDATLTPPLSLLDSKGNVLASSVFTAPQAGSAFFQEAVQGRFALQGPEINQATNEVTLLFAEPVMQNKQVVGVLVAHLDIQQLSINILPILRNADLDHSFAFALDATGRMLIHTDFGELIGISMQEEPWAREMLNRKEGQITYDWADTPRTTAFAPLPQLGWVIGVSLRQEDFQAPQRAIWDWLLGGGLAVTALALLALYLLLRKSHFHLRAGSELALTELGGELRTPSGESPDDQAHILHLGLSLALEKARQNAVRLDHKLANQHERLHAVFTSMMEGIVHIDASGAIVFANPAVLSMLCCREEDVIGKHMQAMLLPPTTFTADSDGFSAVHQAVRASQSQTLTGKILRRQDGSHLLADITVQILHKDDIADGAVLAIRDTSLVDAQQQMLSALSRAADAMYFVWDEQCRLVDCGDNCVTFFLAPGKEALLQNFARYMPERQINGRTSASEIERHQLHALNTGGGSCDWLFRNELGANMPCDLVFRRFTLCGRPAVLGFARDMRRVVETVEKLASGHTNLRQVLDALPVAVGVVGRGTLLYANHAMEEFFALHGHKPDLAPFSPMQSASFASDQAFLQKIDNKHLQFYKTGETMRDYMLSCFPTEFDGTAALMGWLVDVTKLKYEEQALIQDRDQALETIKANRRTLDQLGQDIREPLNDIVFALQKAVQTRNEAELHQAVNTAYASCTPLRETLNRILNIAKEPSPPRVHSLTHFEEDDFFVESPETEKEEALPSLQLPLDATRTQSQGAAKGRILVVDDTPTNVKIMLLILQKMGYEATGTDSGAKALSLLQNTPFDLIFMDIQMPQMNGMETTARIRNDSAGRYPRNIPIVAMTAHAMLGDPEKYLAAGMNDYLSKPVIIEDVANILNNLLQP